MTIRIKHIFLLNKYPKKNKKMPISKTPTPPKTKNLGSVKQVFQTSTEVNRRLNLCVKSKGMKGSTICLISLDEYLQKNNF